MIPWEWLFLPAIVAGIACGVGAFFLARKLLKKELKKNPPINEKMIRAMYSQIGRKPSELQIKSIMNQFKKSLK